MNWASHRRVIYAVGALFAILLLFSVPLYKIITAPPLCTDEKQNGDERGVDCGGACALFCARDAREPIVHWARAFKVSDGIYDMVAYVENPNKEAGVENALYAFKTYDAENILIAETIGKTFLLPGETFPVFLPAVRTGERVPHYTLFGFTEELRFERETREASRVVSLSPVLGSVDTKPRLTAVVRNKTALPVSDIDVIAIIYAGDNAVGASATYIDRIKEHGEENAVFTWPEPFLQQITKIEIIPRLRSRSSQ